MTERYDFVFSYWIFAWFILFELKLVAYNPKIALIVGLIINCLQFMFMVYWLNSIFGIISFFVINLFIKIIPLYLIFNTKTSSIDIYAMIGLFFIYLLWLYVNNIDFYKLIKEEYNNIIHNLPIGPFMHFVNKNGPQS
jgi:hypothetical protein